MKKLFLIIYIVILASCDSDSIKDCFSNPGTTITNTYQIENFEKLHVSEGIEVYIQQAAIPEIKIEVGKNIKNHIEYYVSNNELFLKNKLECKLGATKAAKITVFVPNLTHIHSISQFQLQSLNTLYFPELNIYHGIISESASGIINLNLNATNIIVETNNSSLIQLSGTANNLTVNFWGGNAKIQASQLIAQNIYVLHRSTNHMYLNPMQSIQGDIYGVGNIYLNHIPSIIQVNQHYTGRLIY